MNSKILAVMGLALAVGTSGTAMAMPVAKLAAFVPLAQDETVLVIPAQYYDDDYYVQRRRPRITVYPDAYFDDYSNRYPARRGFEDRNPVPRGNMRGCTVDLGYGRYESCDKN